MSAFLVAMLLAASQPTLKGADKPVFARSWQGPASEGIEGAFAKVTCRAHATFAVVETNDPGLRGLKSVIVRVRAPGMKASAVCAESFTGETHDVTREDRYVLGVHGSFLFLRGGDGFGAEMPLEVVNVTNGATVWSTTYFDDQGARVRTDKKTGRVSLELVLALQGDLLAAEPGLSPENLKLRDEAVKQSDRCPAPHGGAQVGVPAIVDDLATPGVRLLPGKISCGVDP